MEERRTIARSPASWLAGGLLFLEAVIPVAPAASVAPATEFRVQPYLQAPAPDAVTVIWFSTDGEPGILTWIAADGSGRPQRIVSTPEPIPALAYPPWEAESFFGGQPPAAPYRHRARPAGLSPQTAYAYAVQQGTSTLSDTFTTAPGAARLPLRLIFIADSETEPESTGSHTDWVDPTGASATRPYPLDQTTGFANNLAVIRARRPDLLVIAGDLVESGGEQRDWDEFWRQLGDVDGHNLPGRIPLLAVPGNHEYYEGPQQGGYGQPGSEKAVARYLAYFEYPSNGSSEPADEDRYYRLDYGPASLIGLDVTNGQPHRSAEDTNYYLLGQGEAGGGYSPGFQPGTRQYAWLEEQLLDAQQRSAFTFVVIHHVPHSVGPHGWPPGPTSGSGTDPQSGVPVRALMPLFVQYGVDAIIAGHDEIWERSVVEGAEELPDGSRRPHAVQVYDVGTAGDGLRGPQAGLTNTWQRFLVHRDVPEVWENGVLVSGGKHYGHLELDLLPGDTDWQAVLKPVHVFPLFADSGRTYLGCERRLYDDMVTLTAAERSTAVAGSLTNGIPRTAALHPPYPNPFNSTVVLGYEVATEGPLRLEVYDELGRRVRILVDAPRQPGRYAVEWNGRDDVSRPVASGVYLVSLKAKSTTDTVQVTLTR